ncbi:hypothetical protein ACIPY5_19700 [Microbacterium sp. NPDC089698]|uniref:hypothetical protein n=1 Tax=Microbacterium sp. NPDC089698 TaxID=3364200 RepID=UPI00381634F0
MKITTGRCVTALLAGALLLGAGLAPTAAMAAETTSTTAVVSSDEQRQFDELTAHLTEFLSEYGVAPDTQQALVVKLRSGTVLDSMTEASPVSTDTSASDAATKTIETFQDGSIRVTSVEKPKPAPDPGTISTRGGGFGECSQSGDENHQWNKNCSIERWDGIITQHFYANFTYVTPGYDYIDSVWGATYQVWGASSASQTYFGITKQYEDAAGPAVAEQRVAAQVPVLGSMSYYLALRVGYGGATVEGS